MLSVERKIELSKLAVMMADLVEPEGETAEENEWFYRRLVEALSTRLAEAPSTSDKCVIPAMSDEETKGYETRKLSFSVQYSNTPIKDMPLGYLIYMNTLFMEQLELHRYLKSDRLQKEINNV